MENDKKKCSVKKHEQIDAISYCQECNIFMCNKCKNHHIELFDLHHLYNLDKNPNEIFTGFCKEIGHNKELNYFCNSHNILCCAVCLCKIEDKGIGKHKDCQVSKLKEIEKSKIQKLIENIKWLEDFNKDLNKSLNELKIYSDKSNEIKEKLIKEVQEIFTKIRNEINNREDELLLEINKYYEKFFIENNLSNKIEKLPKIIKESIEKGKLLENNWDKNTNLNSLINDCIKIENTVKEMTEINIKLKNSKDDENIKMKFNIDENEIKDISYKIKSLGKISNNRTNVLSFKFREGPNYTLNNNGLIATKTSGGDNWNCTIMGNKEIPKNKISKWKIRLNNFQIKGNTWNILIGIGPFNYNNTDCFYDHCWTLICGSSQLSIKSGSRTKYIEQDKKLKKGDIVEVIADRINGDLSFSVNNINYGLTNIKIPQNDELYPIVMIYDENQIVELV